MNEWEWTHAAIGGAASGQGKVMVDTPKGRMELPARSRDPQRLSSGELVEVVGTDSGVLWVSRATE